MPLRWPEPGGRDGRFGEVARRKQASLISECTALITSSTAVNPPSVPDRSQTVRDLAKRTQDPHNVGKRFSLRSVSSGNGYFQRGRSGIRLDVDARKQAAAASYGLLLVSEMVFVEKLTAGREKRLDY